MQSIGLAAPPLVRPLRTINRQVGRNSPTATSHARTFAMERALEPELLDSLPPSHPDALHNRRDLRLTNVIMRNYAWLRRTLQQQARRSERMLEIGAGDGELGRHLARVGIKVDGLDLWARPSTWPAESDWHLADLRQFEQWGRYSVVIGNLIFHQFADAELRALGERLRDARLIVACEPARRRASQVVYASIGPLLGANHVTLHDAHVSIRAGFQNEELAHALGLTPTDWEVRTTITFMGAYRMVAVRRR
jgi:2-polyprenyl-3-methyl-5-hydroxy-6-metoxy-1,4-benzoquinol methylase